MALIEVSSSLTPIDPSQLFVDGFELSTQSIIPSKDYSGSFTEGLNNVEFYVYDTQKRIQYSDYNFGNYTITTNSTPNAKPAGNQLKSISNTFTTNTINLNPEKDVYDAGFDNGSLTAIYNFVNHELSSSIDNPYYLSEISSDRTEVRLKSNNISNSEMQSSFIEFESILKSADFFDEFYISFGNNENHIGVNTQIDTPQNSIDGVPEQYSILIKLYDALPTNYKIQDQVYVVTKTGETQAFQVEFEDSLNIPDDSIRLQGPNTNLNLGDFVNNSSTYKNREELIETKSSSSKDELLNVLKRKGIHLTPNYSSASFNEFVNFSSVKSRINNFYTKVQNIQTYENDIRLISATTASNASTVSSSLSSLWTKVEDEIKNFDGYEYYQYYNTSSDAYPKDTSSGKVYPYELLDTTDSEVLRWLGSDDPLNQYFGGITFSASRYDENNENWLYYTIPTFITEQNNNDNYVEFCNMIGQSFDELWLYTKTITEKLNTTNELDKGVPLSLADDVITSLGYTGFGNNYNNQDNFIGLIGNDNGSYVPPTGSELITNYIAINNGQIINYWDPDYSWEGYVEQLITEGFPYPIDKVSKEIFKRLYHNMSYLVKKKGTIAGLRQLINIWGIPSTILRINEFGGKNKDETDDYDLWYQRYSYAYTPVANSYRASASAVVPWMPLERNYIAETEYIVPDGVGLRFKTMGYPSSSYVAAGGFDSQSIAVKKSNGLDDDNFDWSIALFHTGSTSGSYQGAGNSDYKNYGELKFFMSTSADEGGVVASDPIYLPFFDGGWWTILLQRDNHSNSNTAETTYTLYAKNKLYDGWDGNSIGFEGSASITNFDTSAGGAIGTDIFGTALYGGYISESLNHGWNKFGVNELDGVYIGGRLNGSRISTDQFITNNPGYGFSGSFQEFRYYSNDISESVFNDTVMNPESIEGNTITGSESSFDIINFRAPLGNELESTFTSSQLTQHKQEISSSHPAFSASAPEYITGSFIDPNTSNVTSDYYIQYEANTTKRTYSKTNVETYFLDQPAIGIRNRVTNKIQSTSNLNFGTALSPVVSIQKDPFISQSYTENINTLEVAFSPQDEINDDIIQTFGYGVIQSAIADPRFRSSSADTYPQLDKIADNYFRKYVGSDIFDYLRLIKYFDDSLFKAIKNYVPARTSVSTGIVIKQNMLERNRYREPQVNSYTTQSYAINNIPLPQQNLELTGSVDLYEVSGGAGGSVNEYNVQVSQSGYYGFSITYGPGSGFSLPPSSYLNINMVDFTAAPIYETKIPGVTPTQVLGDIYGELNNDFSPQSPSITNPYTPYFKVSKPIKTQFSFFTKTDLPNPLSYTISSSIRGELYTTPLLDGSSQKNDVSPFIDILPEETIAFFAYNPDVSSTVTIEGLTVKTWNPSAPYINGQYPVYSNITETSDISSSLTSKQAYIENNITTLGIIPTIGNFQEEFYDGEYSGSAIKTLVTQYNPYKSIPPSSVLVSPSPTALSVPFIIGPNDTDDPAQFTNQTPNGWDYSSQGEIFARIQLFFDIANGLFFDGIAYTINYTVTVSANDFPASQYIGPSPNTYVALDPSLPISANNFTNIGTNGFDTQSIQDANGGGNIIAPGLPKTVSYSITFTFQSPAGYPTNVGYPLAFQLGSGQDADFSNFSIVNEYVSLTKALIPWDLNVINNYNPLTSGSFDIWNTQSLIFENSDFNPLNNNVSQSRKSTNHYVLDIKNQQKIENLQNIIGVMYNPLSSSQFADVPDSNYTALAELNPTYRGTKIKSLDYNFFTPSGSVGVIQTLKSQPYNRKLPNVSSSVADSFLDGSTGSWDGDDVDGRKTSVIDKHPRYIAHFNNSFSQRNFYDSRDFTIDSLISISMEDLSGKEITPQSIEIDGSNRYKKWVSSAFEPNRKVGVSFTSLNSINTKTLSLQTLPVGDYDLIGGSVQFLTINSNAQSKSTNSGRYFYALGNKSISQITQNPVYFGATTPGQPPLFTQNDLVNVPGFLGNLTGSVGTANIIESGSGLALPRADNFSFPFYNGQIGTIIDLSVSISGVAQPTWTGNGEYPKISITKVNPATLAVTEVKLWSWTAGQQDSNGEYNYFVGKKAGLKFKPGDEITIPAAYINYQFGYSGMVGDLKIRLGEENVQSNGSEEYGPLTEHLSADPNQIQMITSSQVIDQVEQFGFLLSGSSTVAFEPYSEVGSAFPSPSSPTVASSAYWIPFARNDRNSGFQGIPETALLALGGPQLAVIHAYNQTVFSQSVRGPLECPLPANNINKVDLWVNEGIDAADPDNYYNWVPSSSGCEAYENNQLPFLIERGDVIRVEGVKTLRSTTTNNLTSSIDFIEDFTVLEVQNFTYTSSIFAPLNGTLIANSAPLVNNVTTPTPNLFPNDYDIGNYNASPGQANLSVNSVEAPDGSPSGTGPSYGIIKVVPTALKGIPGIVGKDYVLRPQEMEVASQGAFAGSGGINIGDTLIITAATVNSAYPGANALKEIRIVVTSNMVNQVATAANNFSVWASINPGCGAGGFPDWPYNIEQAYGQQSVGMATVTLPSFLKTDRNPAIVLEGLPGGAITKFTLRRQVENDEKVMIKNTPETLGSNGFLTQTGGGFLIPNDLSDIQKENALNTINQLRSKNAFPGDTATDSRDNQTS